MKIVFASDPGRFGFPFRIIGNAGRYDTISDCEFLDTNRIVCVDRQMAQLYLLSIDDDLTNYRILDSQTVICNRVPQHFELISIRTDHVTGTITLYSISYRNTLFSCNIVNNKFCNFQTTIIRPDEKYHGVLAFGADNVYLTNMTHPSITIYNVKSGITRTIVCSGGTRMKDVAILDADHMVAISSDSGPTNGTLNPDGTVSPYCTPYDSHALIYNRHTAQLMARYTFPNTQIDGCIYVAPFCFVTCNDADGNGYIWRSTIDSSYQFTEVKTFPCAGFPHGLALRGDRFAYTSYSESALIIEDVGDFGLFA
jgi:hypothetical protein